MAQANGKVDAPAWTGRRLATVWALLSKQLNKWDMPRELYEGQIRSPARGRGGGGGFRYTAAIKPSLRGRVC
jgi:hypothetical protein